MSKTRSAFPFFARRALLGASIFTASMALTGCLVEGDESTSTSTSNADTVTNPVHDIESERQITGTIQGILRDRVSGNPIVGAVISVGVQQATSNELGQYVIENVPVTTPTYDDGGDEVYQVTIDLRDIEGEADYPYPDFFYDTARVTFGRFTPIEAEAMDGENFQQGTFHQVISGLVTALDLQVGKLSTSVSGRVVAGLNELRLDPHAPLTGATVSLYQTSSVDQSNRVVAQTTTDADGNFSFSEVEAQAGLRLVALFEDDYGEEYYGEVSFVAPERDGEEVRFNLLDSAGVVGLRGPALQVSLLEQQGPVIRQVTPENYSDLSLSDGSTEVRFYFNRPLRDNVYARALEPSASAIEGLYRDVEVTYDGTKIDHGALRPNDDEPRPNYTLSWEDNYQVLVVSLENLAESALYTVDISAAEGASKLVDLLNRPARLSGFGSHAAIAQPRVEFTTRGDGSPDAPEISLTASNVDIFDTLMLQWSAVDNARLYRVYTQRVALNGDVDDYLPGYWELDEVTTAHYSVGADLISSDNHPVAVYFKVTAVSADDTESGYSNVIGPITDTVAPSFVVPNDVLNLTGTYLELPISEPVREFVEEDSARVEILLSDADENVIDVVEVEAFGFSPHLAVEINEAMDIPSFDDLADETLGQIRTGWNGVWRAGLNTVLENNNVFDYERVNRQPALSTGLCLVVDNAEGNLFSRNSDDYQDGEVLSMTLSVLDTGLDEIVHDDDNDVFYVYTGANGVCNSISALLNFYHDELNDGSNDSPWIGVAENEDGAVVDNDFSGVAQWAVAELEGALLGSVSVEIDWRHFRLANRAESLTQLARAGVDEFWTDPDDLSLPTLSQLTQNNDVSRPGSAAPLGAQWQFVLPGEAPIDSRPGVLYFDDDAEEANFAWRGTRTNPNTNVVVYEFRDNSASDFEGLEDDVDARGERALPYSLNEHVRSVEVLRVVADSVEDIAGNTNASYTLVRTYTRSEDLSTTEAEDRFIAD
ncbi:carboxypeptidase-like regulatory domain-containing protein [Marinimicrobium alkaliphilum]|uniref:carboxypeptidase-like regulatory domain-containing protein n=1 Tax=Marinimicrobium alkaliphilum TaxID=2202654 RepID=UPI000DB98851|nr:carboxypeptidase-like regulatory domain-containing protein [Marinimicrobium alkaliphilum]